MKITKELIEKAIVMKSKRIRVEEIAKALGISARTVQKHTINFPHPNRRTIKQIPKMSKYLSKEKAEILGYLASEGSQYITECEYLEYDYRRNNTYKRKKSSIIIEFSNKDETIQKRFKTLMFKIFDYETKFTMNGSLKILRKKVIKNLSQYTKFGSHHWRVPKAIIHSKNEKIKASFCRAFCDGDGTVEMNKKEVRIDSVNGIGLKQLQDLFKDLNVDSMFYEFSSRFRLVIKDVNTFKERIGFLQPYKLHNLNKIITKYAPRRGISGKAF